MKIKHFLKFLDAKANIAILNGDILEYNGEVEDLLLDETDILHNKKIKKIQTSQDKKELLIILKK